MQKVDASSALSSLSQTEEARARPQADAMFGGFPSSNVSTPPATGLFSRLKALLAKLLFRRQPAAKALSVNSAEVVTRLTQLSRPIVFKHTASTLVTPIGSYAGNASYQSQRQQAEDAFRKLESPHGSSIN